MGSPVNDLSFTSPRSPCAPPIWATQTRSATAPYPRASAGRRRATGGSSAFRRSRAFRRGRRLDGFVEKAQHPVGRQRTFGEPGLDLVEIELEALGLVLGQQRIEIAEPLDEAAIARGAAVRDHDVINRPLLGSGAGETD